MSELASESSAQRVRPGGWKPAELAELAGWVGTALSERKRGLR